MAIEIDGDSHGNSKASQQDKIKEKHLLKLGIDLVRYDDHDVKSNIQGTIDHLTDWIETRNQ